MTQQLQSIIDLAWEARAQLDTVNSPEIRQAVEQVIADLNKGRIRVAERQAVGQWTPSGRHRRAAKARRDPAAPLFSSPREECR